MIGSRLSMRATFCRKANSTKNPGQSNRASRNGWSSPVRAMLSTNPTWSQAVKKRGSSSNNDVAPYSMKIRPRTCARRSVSERRPMRRASTNDTASTPTSPYAVTGRIEMRPMSVRARGSRSRTVQIHPTRTMRITAPSAAIRTDRGNGMTRVTSSRPQTPSGPAGRWTAERESSLIRTTRVSPIGWAVP